MGGSVDIDEDAICGETLRTVASDGISMIKMRMLGRVELNGRPSSRRRVMLPFGVNFLDHAKLAVCDSELLIGCGELNAFANREFSFYFAIDAHSREPFRIVRDLVAARLFNRQEILDWVNGDDGAIGSRLDSSEFASSRIPHYVIDLIAGGPSTLCTCHVLARR